MSAQVYLFALLTALTWGTGFIPNKRGLAAGGTPLQSCLTMGGVVCLILWTLILIGPGGGKFFSHLSLSTVCIFALAGLCGSALGNLLTLSGTDHVGASINSAVSNTRPAVYRRYCCDLVGRVGTTFAGCRNINVGGWSRDSRILEGRRR